MINVKMSEIWLNRENVKKMTRKNVRKFSYGEWEKVRKMTKKYECQKIIIKWLVKPETLVSMSFSDFENFYFFRKFGLITSWEVSDILTSIFRHFYILFRTYSHSFADILHQCDIVHQYTVIFKINFLTF